MKILYSLKTKAVKLSMEKTFLLFFFVFGGFIVRAQTPFQPDLKVEYSCFDRCHEAKLHTTLVMNARESIRHTDMSQASSDARKEKMNNGMTKIISAVGFADRFIHILKDEDTLIQYRDFKGDSLAISENIPKLNWHIDAATTKKIGAYKAQKATVKFRGRTYRAWFTPEIPAFFGPWKFTGLPGLILEIEDQTQTYQWVVTHIETRDRDLSGIKISYENPAKMSLKEYVDKVDRYNKQQAARLQSRAPEGVKVNHKPERHSIKELVYEWEK